MGDNGHAGLLASLPHRVSRTQGWTRRGIALLAGALSVLSMAPVFFWPVLFFTLPILVWLLDGAVTSPAGYAKTGEDTAHDVGPLNGSRRWAIARAAAHDAWWFAFGYFFFGLFWIGEAFLVEAHIFGWLLPLAITVMPAGLALFWAAAAAGAVQVWRPSSTARVLVLAIGVGLAEWLRGHAFTGFPWNILGYALTQPLTLMQSASVLGIYGLTVWVVVICTTPLIAIAAISTPGRVAGHRLQYELVTGLSVLPLLAMTAFGWAAIPGTPTPTLPDVRVRIVQPSTPQHEKWVSEKQREIFDDHIRLSKTNPDGRIDNLAGITHVIWAEASMPFLPLSSPQAMAEIGALLPPNVHLLAGALRLQRQPEQTDEALPDLYAGQPAKPRAFNSLLVFGQGGGLAAIYDKIHLVPFGEYLPFQQTLEAVGLQSLTRIRGGFAVGEAPRRLMSVPGLPLLSPLICYEAIFPGSIVQGRKRPGLLLNVTNDGWFGNWTGPFQHFHQARLRAVEEGVPLIRVGNNGVSAVIDPYGRIVSILNLNQSGSLDSNIPVKGPITIFARINNLLFFASIFFFFALVRIMYSGEHRLGER